MSETEKGKIMEFELIELESVAAPEPGVVCGPPHRECICCMLCDVEPY